MWIKDTDGKILKVNDKYVESCGKSEEEIIGKTDYDIFPIEVAEQYVNEDNETIAKNQRHVLYKKGKSNNNYIELEIRKSPIFDNQHQVIETLGMAIDTSNMDEKSQELKASRERIYRMYQDSVLGIFRLTKTGKIIETNTAFVQMFGYDSLSDLKSSIHNFFSELHMNHENENQLKKELFVDKKDSCKCDELFRRKDQSSFHGSVFARKVYCKEIKDICIEGYIEDISERKKIEFDLLFEKSLLNNLMDHTVDHIYFKDLKSSFIRVNNAWLKARSKEEIDQFDVVGKSDFDFFDKDIAEIAKKDEINIIKTGKPIINKIEKQTNVHDGSTEWLSATKMPLYDFDSNEIIGTFGISRDVTERIRFFEALKKSENELKEINATKDRFFSIIAHDLKNPVNTILGFSELLLRNVKKGRTEKLSTYSNLIHTSAKNLFDLLQNLLEWSRIQIGAIHIRPVHIDIADIIQSVSDFFEFEIRNKKIQIITDIKTKELLIADENMLKTVLRNLISNAIKFTEEEGQIKISVNKENKAFQIIVSDTGIGIPKNILPKLFRIENSFTTQGTQSEKGTGIGLILCKEFVEKNNGTIRVESTENVGTTFYLEFMQ